jgi:multiple antibiotic resistance protein
VTQSFVLAFVSLFVALDIIGTLPLYVSMTQGLGKRERARVVGTSIYVAFFVALTFLFVGEAIFRFLGITLSDFKIAGGIVLLLVSLADLVGQHEASNRASGSTGIVPLAVPLITGPGVLATLIFQVGQYGYGIPLASLLANYLIAWLVLRNSGVVVRLIGKDGMVVISKIAALLLAAIAVAMIRSGLVDAIKAY